MGRSCLIAQAWAWSNLSSSLAWSEGAPLRMPEFAGRGLRDLFGGLPFPALDDAGQLTLTLGSHDFFWLRVRSARSNPASPLTEALPVLTSVNTRSEVESP